MATDYRSTRGSPVLAEAAQENRSGHLGTFGWPLRSVVPSSVVSTKRHRLTELLQCFSELARPKLTRLEARPELGGVVCASLYAQRVPQMREHHRGKIPDMVMISERPAEVADRAVPGRWEGDLVVGSFGRSAFGTLVERTTRYLILLHLQRGHSARAVRDALTIELGRLPARFARSLTWTLILGDAPAQVRQHRHERRRLLLRPALAVAAKQ